jgi:hypothetical protein
MKAVFVSSALNTTGTKLVDLCLPSHQGWLVDSPQEHQAYVFPASNSTGIGDVPAIVGLSIVVDFFY